MNTATFPTASSSTSTNPQSAPAGSRDGANPTYGANRNDGANRLHGVDGAQGTDSAQGGHGETRSGGAPDTLKSVAQGAHQTIDRLAVQVTPQVHRLQQSVAGATDMLDERAVRLREMTDAWMDALRSTVRENPLAAVGAALALGMLVARLSG